MIRMFKSFFAMFEQLFGAGERFASALNHIGEWTDESAAAYADQARLERKAASIQGKQALAKQALAKQALAAVK